MQGDLKTGRQIKISVSAQFLKDYFKAVEPSAFIAAFVKSFEKYLSGSYQDEQLVFIIDMPPFKEKPSE